MIRTRTGFSCLLVALLARPLAAQVLPRTVAERSAYAATSTHAEVGAFLDSLQLAGAPIAVTEMGTTTLGKPLYLVIASDPAVTSPAEAAASGKLVVYLQANIHAGEVEGKEALLAVLRELAGPRRELLQRLVVLAVPDYNPDGNDAMAPVAVSSDSAPGGSRRFNQAMAVGRVESCSRRRRIRATASARGRSITTMLARARPATSSAAAASSTWIRSMSGRPRTVGPMSPERLSGPTTTTQSMVGGESIATCNRCERAAAARGSARRGPRSERRVSTMCARPACACAHAAKPVTNLTRPEGPGS